MLLSTLGVTFEGDSCILVNFCKMELFVFLHRCDYQRAVRLDPMCLPARVNLAYTLQVAGRFMQAWRQFSTAIDIKPSKYAQ